MKLRLLFALWLAGALAGCQPRPVPEATTRPAPPPKLATHGAGLLNVLTVTDGLVSGSAPGEDVDFRALCDMGIQTIISVDGATPDVEAARRYGLRYVHLPIGYDGVPRDQALRIARAVRDLPGKVYLHCHHGQHRGPAAAAAAALCLDEQMNSADAVAFMRKAGTDPRYKGLYSSVESFRRPTVHEWAAVSGEFPEVTKVSALAEVMVAVDERWDRLKAVRGADWQTPTGHADLDPPHEALQLRQQFREAGRLADRTSRPDEMWELLTNAEGFAAELEAALRRRDKDRAEPLFLKLQSTCRNCHERFRDRPAQLGSAR